MISWLLNKWRSWRSSQMQNADTDAGFVQVCVLMVREAALLDLESLRMRAGAADYAELVQFSLVAYEATLDQKINATKLDPAAN